MGELVAAVSACVAIIGSAMAGMIWVIKRLVNAALANMAANTAAIEANTSATRSLSNTLTQAIAVRDERDKTMFKQLDRIEEKMRPRS